MKIENVKIQTSPIDQDYIFYPANAKEPRYNLESMLSDFIHSDQTILRLVYEEDDHYKSATAMYGSIRYAINIKGLCISHVKRGNSIYLFKEDSK